MPRVMAVQHVPYSELKNLETPAGTETHRPIAHSLAASLVIDQLNAQGWDICDMDFGITHGGDRMFGLLQINMHGTDYSLSVGVRNAHDKRFTYGMVAGATVTVCGNLWFFGDVISFTLKHCKNIFAGLSQNVANAVFGLRNMQLEQARVFDSYRGYHLTDSQAHDFVIRALREGVVPSNKVLSVVNEYHEPRHTEFAPRTLWSLANAFTEILKDTNRMDMPERSNGLHRIANEMVISRHPIAPVQVGAFLS